MPHTAATLGVNAWNPSENLRGTSRYLSTLVNTFRRPQERHRAGHRGLQRRTTRGRTLGGIPPYAETQNYVVRVLDVWKELKLRIARAPAPQARALRTPEERQWVTAVDAVLPESAHAATASAVSAPTVSAPTVSAPTVNSPADEGER